MKFFWRKRNQIPSFKKENYINRLTDEALCEILSFSEERLFETVLSRLEFEKALILSPQNYITRQILKRKSGHLCAYHLPEDPLIENHPKLISIRGDDDPLSLKSESFDFVFCPAATQMQRDLSQNFNELSRVLKRGGRLLMSVPHPSFEFFIKNQNPNSNLQAESSLEFYLDRLRRQNLYLEVLKEGQVNQNLKPFFEAEGHLTHYDELKGLPLVLFLKVVKFVSQRQVQKERKAS